MWILADNYPAPVMHHPMADGLANVLVNGLGDIGFGVISALAGHAYIRGYDISVQACRRATNAHKHVNVTAFDVVARPLVHPGDIVIDCTRGSDSDALWSLLGGEQARALVHFSSFAVYGARVGNAVIQEDCPRIPLTDYGQIKVREKDVVRALSRETMMGAIADTLPIAVLDNAYPPNLYRNGSNMIGLISTSAKYGTRENPNSAVADPACGALRPLLKPNRFLVLGLTAYMGHISAASKAFFEHFSGANYDTAYPSMIPNSDITAVMIMIGTDPLTTFNGANQATDLRARLGWRGGDVIALNNPRQNPMDYSAVSFAVFFSIFKLAFEPGDRAVIEDGSAITAACAAHLGFGYSENSGPGDDLDIFARLLCDLSDPGLPPSTFTDMALAILFSLAKGFEPDVMVSLDAYRGVGARAQMVGWLIPLSRSGRTAIREVLCDMDPDRGSQLHRHRGACIGRFDAQEKSRLEGSYTSSVSHTPSPDILDQVPMAARYLALIDLDSHETGKAGYAVAARHLIETQKGAGVLIFHDVCVPRFANDIASLKETLVELGVSYLELPIDDCGLGVAYAA